MTDTSTGAGGLARHSMPRLGPVDRELSRRDRPLATGFFIDFAGPAPATEDVRRRVLARATGLPALHVTLSPDGRAWQRTPRVDDVGVHVRHRTGISGVAELERLTSHLLRAPLPGDGHSAWDMWLLSGYGPQRFRIAFRVDHAQLDGVGAAHTALGLLADTPCAGPRLLEPSSPSIAGFVHLARDLTRSLHPARVRHHAAACPGGQVRFAHAQLNEEEVRARADILGVNVNDACLAALALALGAWQKRCLAGMRRRDIPAFVPMSTRQAHERYAAGNRLAAYRLLLPCTAGTLAEAADQVRRQTTAARNCRRRESGRAALNYLPLPLGLAGTRLLSHPTRVPVVASSITFPEAPVCFGARPVGASMFCDLRTGSLGYMSFTRVAGTVRCGVAFDARNPGLQAVPDDWSDICRSGT
ncbi:wax ester/triacylglycerol synthase domain-containing protein [Streptomyces cinnamoneus]|uniref:wax ester/triacylglycerol synthase domain-containing protein n=1 Tax=Streptomyces cinnamoneus TaxID=53446 RepID=UPI003417237B